MSTTVTPPAEGTTESFDARSYIDKRNQAEQATRSPQAATIDTKTETKAAAAAATAGTEHQQEEETQGRLPRSARREINRLRDEVGRLTGQLDLLKELGIIKTDGVVGKTETAKQTAIEDPQPQRKDYADDAQFQTATAAWTARQETRKELGKRDELAAGEQRNQAFRQQIQAMQAKTQEDLVLFDDWDTVKAAAAEAGEVEFAPEEHPQLMALIALSDVQAGIGYHLAKNPKVLQNLLSLTKRPEEQIKAFHRLEGQIEGLYYTDERRKAAQARTAAGKGKTETGAGKDRKPAEGTSRERRAAALPAPTESASAAGGSAPATDVQPVLNGKINPAWKALRNEREGLRR